MVSAYLTNLITRQTNVSAELAAMDATKAGGLANVNGREGGTTLDHVEHRRELVEELGKLAALIKDAQNVDDAANGGELFFEFDTMYDT